MNWSKTSLVAVCKSENIRVRRSFWEFLSDGYLSVTSMTNVMPDHCQVCNQGDVFVLLMVLSSLEHSDGWQLPESAEEQITTSGNSSGVLMSYIYI